MALAIAPAAAAGATTLASASGCSAEARQVALPHRSLTSNDDQHPVTHAIAPTPEFMVACRELSRYGSAMLDQAIIVPEASALLRLHECDHEAGLGERRIAPIGCRARAVAGSGMRLSIARTVDVEALCRLPTRRVGCELAVAQRKLARHPRQPAVKIVRAPHAKGQALREVRHGVADAHARNQPQLVALVEGLTHRAWRHGHYVWLALLGAPNSHEYGLVCVAVFPTGVA